MSVLLAGFFVFAQSTLILFVVIAGLIGYRAWTDEPHRMLWIAALVGWLVVAAELLAAGAASQLYVAAATAPLLALTIAWVLLIAVRRARSWTRAATALALAVWILGSLVGVGSLELVVAAGGLQWPATTGLP